jgi:indolepyruvate ferredoxin oxidoreductase, beta subunit
MMKTFNVYLIGVGGQGIGLLSEILLRAADHAGHRVMGVDTHGLAQRGGVVVSHLRIGDKVYTPMIPEGEADLVVGLERHEAARGLTGYLKDGGTLVYYNTVWQPLDVRLNVSEEISEETVSRECRNRNIREVKAFSPELPDGRMQNIAILANIDQNDLIPGVGTDHYREAMADLMTGDMLEKNLAFFKKSIV